MAGGRPTPLPGPGVYARHNAVDMPALLPDGSPAGLSVSPVIAAGRRSRASRGGVQGDGARTRRARPGPRPRTPVTSEDGGHEPGDTTWRLP